jgi:putative membrane protein
MWPYMGWWMAWWWVTGLVVLVLFVRLVTGSTGRAVSRSDETPEQILKRRYAKGEIEREEYLRRLDDVRR